MSSRLLKTLSHAAESDLFGTAPAWPQELIAAFHRLPLAPFQFGAFKGKRRVASFGFRYDSAISAFIRPRPCPKFIRPVIARVEQFGKLETDGIRHVLFTEYETGTGIGWHRDKAAFDLVFGLSLASACRFRFRRRKAAGWERFTLEAEPRSLYLMSGEARLLWEHSIPEVEAPRYSVTFRTMA